MDRSFDPSSIARGRLAVLSAHITAASGDLQAVIASSPVSAAEISRTPVKFGGTLTVIDGRTGKKYEIRVSDEGTVKATDFKKITIGKNDKGLKLYDPGYLNTAPVQSSIWYIDGDEGILGYRGYPIEELAESRTFVECMEICLLRASWRIGSLQFLSILLYLRVFWKCLMMPTQWVSSSVQPVHFLFSIQTPIMF